MPHTTAKGAIKKVLQDLRKAVFLEFCHQLRDRRKDPRVCLQDVEDKTVLEITDLLVSTFTEPKACEVTVELLRQINHNDEADRLYSKTKACMDKGAPIFRKTSTGEVERKPSQEALNYSACQLPLQARSRRGPPAKKPEEVENDAKARVISECGDPNDERVVLSRSVIQFGKYKGQTNQWLLENDLDYAAFIVATREKDQKPKDGQNWLMANKDCLTRYATAYPEFKKELRFQREYQRSLESGQNGKALVGFGKHRSMTLKDLYESKDEDIISYVDWLRNKGSTRDLVSRMEIAVKYILQRDRRRAAARKRTQSTRDQSTSAPRPKQRKRTNKKTSN